MRLAASCFGSTSRMSRGLLLMAPPTISVCVSSGDLNSQHLVDAAVSSIRIKIKILLGTPDLEGDYIYETHTINSIIPKVKNWVLGD